MAKKIEFGVEEVATILGVSDRQVRKYIGEKELQAKKVGKTWFVDKASVDRVLSARSQVSTRLPEPLSEPLPELGPIKHGVKLKRSGNPESLACFRIAQRAFLMPLWRQESGPMKSPLKDIEQAVVKSLGAGYYSYGATKVRYYSEARAQVGGALGLLYQDPKAKAKWAADVAFIESDLVPALSSLIKKIERSIPR